MTSTSISLVPLTQKAQGIVAIQEGCHVLSLKGPGHPLMVIPGSEHDCCTSSIIWPMFARPCPFRPRHGFEESIRVHAWIEVISILQRAHSLDPNNPVEIVLAPVLTGKVSAVATNAGVTWGRGNDGVTSGTDPHALFIPVKTSKSAWNRTVRHIVDSCSDFRVPEFAYLEIVENKGEMCLVQVRDGPEQPEGANHVVRKMKVQHILTAYSHINLLEWEDLVHQAAKNKGTVIYACGMSLASHFCVHGIESGIPVITDHIINIGDVIQPTKNRTSTLRKHDYEKVAALITETLKCDMQLVRTDTQRSAILTAIATTQAQFCWGREPHLLRLRGLSVAVILKAVLAGCAGEIRHWPTPAGPNTGEPTLYDVLDGIDNLRNKRRQIYETVFNGKFTFAKMEKALGAAEADLVHRAWSRSFGGPRWAEIASVGIELTQAARRFDNQPCAATWSKVVQSANRLINTSHNSGKCLTKWVDSYAMGMISKAPTVGFLNPYVTQVALQMTNEGEKT